LEDCGKQFKKKGVISHLNQQNMLSKLILCVFAFCFYQNANSQSFKHKMTEHTSNIETVTISNDGKLMATGAWDGHIHLYTFDSLGNPVMKSTYTGHLGAVISLSFSANNKFLVSSSKDYSSRIWNIDTPSKHKVFNLHLEPVTAAFIDPSYKYIISASLDGTIRTTNINDPLKSKVIKLSGPINDLQLSKDKKFFYVAVKGGVVKKIETGGKNIEILSFTGHTDEINALELSPDGNFMATASSDKTIQIWNVVTGKSVKNLSGFEWKVTSLKYSSDGKYIIGGCNNGITKLFEIETGKSISEFNDLGKNVRDVTFSRDGKLIFVATLMDSDKFGAVIYNSGIISTPLTTGSSAIKPKQSQASSSKKTNGSK
jgi:WD40 repeat protein